MELFRLLGTIAVSNDEANEAIDDTIDKAEKSGSKISDAFGKIGGAALKVGSVVTKGLAAGATAIAALSGVALNAYADYEQLVGGIETLFETSSEKVMEYADNAYKTAGLSANEYMETVTSFSASLLQSLDGDTAKAAEKADQAITDMADNANKMGTSMESIQNAYQGFAKQNYTMLDNLKLGYGGTKEEMARLLEDATALSGVEYDLSSYADVVDAIHVIQTEMGITGTTAKEASSTISGSVASMKASWSNLIVGIADDNANLDGLIDNFVGSVGTALENIIPRVEKILGGIGDLVTKLVPIIVEKLPGIIDALLPGLISGATSLMVGLIQALPTIIQLLIEYIPLIVTQIGTALIQTIPVLLESAKQIGSQIMGAISGAVSENGGGVFSGLLDAFGTLKGVVSDVFQNSICPLFQDFMTMGQELWTENQDLVNKLGELFSMLGEMLSGIFSVIGELFNWFVSFIRDNMGIVKDIFQSCIDVISGIVDFFISLFKGDWQGMWDAVISILTSAVDIVKNAFTLVKNFIQSILSGIWSKVVEIWENIKLAITQKIESIVDGIKNKFTAAKDAVSEIFTKMKEAVTSIFEGIWNAIKSRVNSIIGGMEIMINAVISGINKLLKGVEEVANAAGELLGFDPITIQLSTVSLPRLAKGGIVDKPTIAEIGEDGAEAVIPLENNTQWIQKVSQEMRMQGIATDNKETIGLLNIIIELLKTIIADNGTLPETLVEAIAALKFDINNREFARLVKAVN